MKFLIILAISINLFANTKVKKIEDKIISPQIPSTKTLKVFKPKKPFVPKELLEDKKTLKNIKKQGKK